MISIRSWSLIAIEKKSTSVFRFLAWKSHAIVSLSVGLFGI